MLLDLFFRLFAIFSCFDELLFIYFLIILIFDRLAFFFTTLCSFLFLRLLFHLFFDFLSLSVDLLLIYLFFLEHDLLLTISFFLEDFFSLFFTIFLINDFLGSLSFHFFIVVTIRTLRVDSLHIVIVFRFSVEDLRFSLQWRHRDLWLLSFGESRILTAVLFDDQLLLLDLLRKSLIAYLINISVVSCLCTVSFYLRFTHGSAGQLFL